MKGAVDVGETGDARGDCAGDGVLDGQGACSGAIATPEFESNESVIGCEDEEAIEVRKLNGGSAW